MKISKSFLTAREKAIAERERRRRKSSRVGDRVAWPTPQPGPQVSFIESDADIVLYGGAAGGGKSFALLMDMAAPERIAISGYSAVIFRRTYPMIRNEGGLWDESQKIYPLVGAEPLESRLEWRFDGGATVRFAHLQHEKNKLDWQGSQLPRMGFDELTHFSETQFFYLLSRARTAIGITPQVRATCNPDADSWVAEFISWWVCDVTGLPIPERSGVVRWFVRVAGDIIWGDTCDELRDRYPGMEPKSFTFIPAKLTDNRILMDADPSYLGNLMAQHPVERARLLEGNWKVRVEAGKFIDRDWIEIVENPPQSSFHGIVRAWDLAATEKQRSGDDPDWSVGVLMGRYGDLFVILDVIRVRLNPAALERLIVNVASQDGRNVPIHFPQDPGQAGKDQIYQKRKLLVGYAVRSTVARGSKLQRANDLAVACEAGRVKLVRGDTNNQFLSVLHSVPDGAHDDDLDAAADAFNQLHRPGNAKKSGLKLY